MTPCFLPQSNPQIDANRFAVQMYLIDASVPMIFAQLETLHRNYIWVRCYRNAWQGSTEPFRNRWTQGCQKET